MMIGFVAENGHGAVELLDGHEADHLVGESHLRKGYFSVCARINLFAKAIRATYDERQILAGSHLLLQEIRILNRPKLTSVFIEQKDIHGRSKARKNRFAFGGLELVLTEGFSVLDIRNDHQFERHVMLEPLLIVVNKRNQPCVSCLPRQKQLNLHL